MMALYYPPFLPLMSLIPLRGETADDVELLVKWMTRANG
jgi:hypothetical protein